MYLKHKNWEVTLQLELIAHSDGEAAVMGWGIIFSIIHASEAEIVAGIKSDTFIFVGKAYGDAEDYTLADIRTLDTKLGKEVVC